MKQSIINKLFFVFLIASTLFGPGLSAQTDLCSGAPVLTPAGTCVTTSYNIVKTWGNEINAPSCVTTAALTRDGWFKFTATATSCTITATNSSRDLALAVYTGCTAGGFVTGSCVNASSGNAASTESVVVTTVVGTTYLIRIMELNGAAKAMAGTICVKVPSTPPANDLCSGAITAVCGNTYVGSTAQATSTGDPTGTCGTSSAAPGVWYKITGIAGNITASLCGSSFDTKIQIYSGSCSSPVCVDGNDDYCSLQSQITWAATLATTYYIFVGGFNGTTGSYSLTVTCDIPSAPNCTNYTSPSNGAILACASANLVWTVPPTGSAPTSYLLYFGTNTAANNIDNGVNITNVLSYSPLSLLPNTTYYWKIVPQNSAGTASGCTTYSFTTGNSVVTNDPCGGATPLTSGVSINDDNSCATADSPLGAGSCWSGGTVNSLWYSINVSSGTLGVLTTLGTLNNTQISVYSGSCASLTEVACNDDAPGPGCDGTATNNSQLNLTGLASGTYYIRVDGRNNMTGTYNIMATTSGNVGTGVPVPGQDCASPIALCANPTSVGNPGYQNTGNICDFGYGGNCTDGEKNALWMQFTATSTGNLLFNIIPNDYNGCDDETDYDWVLYRTTGANSTNCASIFSTDGNGERACNYSYLGVTGMSANGNQPSGSGWIPSPAPASGCYDDSYEPSITATAGDVFLLVIQNFSGSSSGFSLSIPSGGAAVSTAAPTQVLWTGGANTTSVSTLTNWGGCAAPSCSPGVDAIVAASATVQPVVAANLSVKSLTINPGATLTINTNIKLDVCGDFINNGNLVCAAGSTVNFNGTGAQTVGGNLTGINKFSNFMVTKSTGTVNLLSSIEAGQDLITSSATSILNINGVDVTIGGDFLNSNGGTTFTGITSTSSMIFNGSGAQTYNPNKNSATPTLTLNNVTMLNTGSGVTISTTNTPNMTLGTTGVLTLTSGEIITPGNQEVDVFNTASTAVTPGNTTSFVQGNLRRYLAAGATGSFDFPVGEATKGYQLANLNFSTGAAASALNLLARFDQWGGAWTMPGAPGWGPDCSSTYNMPYLNNGYWTINSSITSTGSYNITLHNLNYTNAASGWSVAKSPSASPAWALAGQCQASPVTAVQRLNLSGFSKFATIQSSVPLPVQLINFTGTGQNTYNAVVWHTATETDISHYELESSEDALNFSSIYQKQVSGNSTTTHGYTYNDYAYYSPVTYYRLKIVNNDGTFAYSNIISVEHSSSEFNVTNVYPNPAANEINILVEAPGQNSISVDVTDVSGRQIYTSKFDMRGGSQKFSLNTSSYAEGSYFVTIRYENQPPVNKKIVIQRNN